jgi:5'-phosphate synthase pdxT subunit
MKKVGILALQGSIVEHEKMLASLDVHFISVRTREDLEQVTHLIIPGGESSTLQLLLEQKGMWNMFVKRTGAIPNQVRNDNKQESLKVFGTCAGAILCARAGAKFEVDRNGFGAQQNSFIAPLDSQPFPDMTGVFIRAPRFKNIDASVEVLATFENEPVLLRDRNFLCASFHPELSGEQRIYEYFLK